MSKAVQFEGFSAELRGSSIGGAKTLSKTVVIPITNFIIEYYSKSVSPCQLVFENTRDRELKISCELICDGHGHITDIDLPEEGTYEIYIIKEDGVFLQYNVTIKN